MMQVLDGAIVLNPKPDAKLRLLCFHHAGGSALSFATLARQAPAEAEAILFELPGRGMRARDPFLPDFATAKEYFLERVLPVIDRPVLLFGHSLGGVMAHAIAKSLPSDKQQRVRRVIVSAARSPHSVEQHAQHPSAPFVIRSRESVYEDLIRLDGTPQVILEEKDLAEKMVTTLGCDLHLLDTYKETKKCGQAADLPLELWLGDQDPSVPLEEADLWAKTVTAPLKTRIFTGHHFYLFQQQEAVAAAWRDVIEEVLHLEPQPR